MIENAKKLRKTLKCRLEENLLRITGINDIRKNKIDWLLFLLLDVCLEFYIEKDNAIYRKDE